MVINNVSKDISFQRYLVLDILTNPERVTLTKKGNILGENPLLISLLTYQVQIWLLRMRKKQKKLFNYVRLVGKYAFLAILAILMLTGQKPVQRRGIGEK